MAAERDFELLDDYLTNRLTGSEKEAFQQKLENDPTLKGEFQLQQNLIESIKKARLADLKLMLNNTAIPPVSGGQAALLTKVTASIVVAGVIGAGIYLFLNQDEKVEKAETEHVKISEQPVIADKITEEPEKIAPLNKPAEGKTAPASVDKPIVTNEKTKRKINPKPNQTTPLPSEVKSIDRQKPDAFDPTNEVESSTKPENDAVKAKTKEPEVISSSIEVETDNTNKKYNFHYQFKAGKLFLYGSFEQNLYEIMEFFNGNKRTVFLYYKDSYYLLNEENEKIKPLASINDPVLQQKLKEYREKN